MDFFNGQLDPSWMGAPGAAPKVLPTQAPGAWNSSMAAAPSGMSIGMLVNLINDGNPQQTQWAEQELNRRAGDPSGGSAVNGGTPAKEQVGRWINQYTDPNVQGAMQQLMNGRTPDQVMQTMTGYGGNGLQGQDPNTWMQQINSMQNALNGIGIGGDPTHGYSADSPFNPMNANGMYNQDGSYKGMPGIPGAVAPNGSSAPGSSVSSGNSSGAAINAAGSGNANDIAYQNQLRRNAMDSQQYNPNGTNTWGIQNGTAANLSAAFNGGVFSPGASNSGSAVSSPAAPSSVQPPVIGTTGAAGATPSAMPLPGQNSTSTPENYAAPTSITTPMSQRGSGMPSYFNNALNTGTQS